MHNHKTVYPKISCHFILFPCQPYCQQLTLDSRRNINIISRTSPKACSLPTHQCLVFYLPMKYSKKSIPLTVSGWRTQDMLLVRRQMHCVRESLSCLQPVFKKSIDDAVFPTNWKLSLVKPVFKKGAPTDMSNFRPISLLSIPGKILEDIISNSIDNHIEAQNLFSDNLGLSQESFYRGSPSSSYWHLEVGPR